MSWLALRFDLHAGRADSVADALLELGALSVEVTDADAGTGQERPLFGEPGGEPSDWWRRSRLCALFSSGVDVEAAVRTAFAVVGLDGSPQLTVTSVEEHDWVAATREQFVPIQVSPRLWIVPSWCAAPDPAAINLRLDPGLAFGTGGHATTWQCLRWLDEHLPAGASVLDYGCGSGVLAIAAKRLGAGQVVAVDLDPFALQTSRANARANQTEIEVVEPEHVPAIRFDVVVANILANPLKLLAPLMARLSAPEGRIVLAGILPQQAQDVCTAYSDWYRISVVSEREGWTCLAGTRTL